MTRKLVTVNKSLSIEEKLAIDWLRVNKWDTKDQTLKRVKTYKKRYKMPAE